MNRRRDDQELLSSFAPETLQNVIQVCGNEVLAKTLNQPLNVDLLAVVAIGNVVALEAQAVAALDVFQCSV